MRMQVLLGVALELLVAVVVVSRLRRGGRLAKVVGFEARAVGFALTGWFRRAPAGYTMHRNTAYLAVIGIFVFLLGVEGAAAHLLIAQASRTAAWIATALSIYAAIWIIGHAHAARLQPLRFTDAGLAIAKGVFWRVTVPLDAIAAAEPIEAKVPGARDLSYLVPNVLLTLRAPIALDGPFGIRRQADRLTLSLDERAQFLAQLSQSSGSSSSPNVASQ
jgi:hypothetical protein